MESKMLTDELEQAYAECWRQGEEAGRADAADSKDQETANAFAWRESVGGLKVLGVMLSARGLVGRVTFPADKTHVPTPCDEQTWIRLMQWGIAKGFAEQAELDEVVAQYPRYAEALKNLGKDVVGVDFGAKVSG